MDFNNDKHSRLMIRIGLGLFFLVFGLLKLSNGQWFVDGPYSAFYGLTFSLYLVYVIGVVQLGMALSFFTNKHSKVSAWIGSVMILSTVLATSSKILSTFTLPPESSPPGFLFFAAVPLLFMALSEAMKEE